MLEFDKIFDLPLKSNGLIYPLLFSVFFLCSCQHAQKERKNLNNKESQNYDKLDSIKLSVRLPPKSTTGFNLTDPYFKNYTLDFRNNNDKDSVITKEIQSYHKNQIINYFGAFFNDGKSIVFRKKYLTTGNKPFAEFNYSKGKITLVESDGLIDVTNIFKSYPSIGNSNDFDTKEILRKLKNKYDSLNEEIGKKYFSKNYLKAIKELNKIIYLDKLQLVNPESKKIFDYLCQVEEPIGTSIHHGILNVYVKNNIKKIDFLKLKKRKRNDEYLSNLSNAVYLFLQRDKNKGDLDYANAINWLKTTNFFKNDSVYIKKEITPLNSELFASKLERLTFESVNHNKVNIKNILDKNSSEYYLIDFWATWCAPCIQGIKTMKNMDLPDNVNVISISVDKNKDKEKWIKTSNKLNQSISYWIDGTDSKTHEFMNFIKMKSIPRYILIDKNMNLIDESYYHPSKPKFLQQLNHLSKI
jgi:thiol-disulfide isomerase/thioredoxin